MIIKIFIHLLALSISLNELMLGGRKLSLTKRPDQRDDNTTRGGVSMSVRGSTGKLFNDNEKTNIYRLLVPDGLPKINLPPRIAIQAQKKTTKGKNTLVVAGTRILRYGGFGLFL